MVSEPEPQGSSTPKGHSLYESSWCETISKHFFDVSTHYECSQGTLLCCINLQACLRTSTKSLTKAINTKCTDTLHIAILIDIDLTLLIIRWGMLIKRRASNWFFVLVSAPLLSNPSYAPEFK